MTHPELIEMHERELLRRISKVRQKILNPKFYGSAPLAVIEHERERLKILEAEKERRRSIVDRMAEIDTSGCQDDTSALTDDEKCRT